VVCDSEKRKYTRTKSCFFLLSLNEVFFSCLAASESSVEKDGIITWIQTLNEENGVSMKVDSYMRLKKNLVIDGVKY
jgi:hypothetical protein